MISNNKYLGYLALAVTVLSGLSGIFEVVNPEIAIYVTALSGALSAFLAKVQPKPSV